MCVVATSKAREGLEDAEVWEGGRGVPTFTNVSMDNQRRKTYRTESSMGFRGFKMIVAYMIDIDIYIYALFFEMHIYMHCF